MPSKSEPTDSHEMHLGYQGEDYSQPTITGRAKQVTRYPSLDVQDKALPDGVPHQGVASARYRVRRQDAGAPGSKPSFSLEISHFAFPHAGSEGDETGEKPRETDNEEVTKPGKLAGAMSKAYFAKKADEGPDV